ncbi:hypothetical protein PQ455_20850 (plasmid) [Sphingomonas naphthae]|uniref:Uncharacterized protein n=1 Tax=Sphingomonas naphthae TaxID=1813468 RepID=A0ABY7TRN8_9SPHN|nr:hypothetical protein [Sphingomonas naphthae]WCT75874.1 hypothetical protein PQ455_20850 [Sphingomonas naphthae]
MKQRSDRIMAEWADGNRLMGFERRDWGHLKVCHMDSGSRNKWSTKA